MKRIIDGKRYDTETAEVVGHDSFGNAGDFRHYRESLYRTKRGAWFLAGHGGPMSKYSRSTGQNSWSGGEAINPLTADEARHWLESVGETDALEKYFPVQDA